VDVPKQDEDGNVVQDQEGNEVREVLLEVEDIHKAILEWNKCHFHQADETPFHQGLDFWNQNDSFLNQNDHTSKRSFFNIRSKIPHKFANLVLICESQSNQRRPNFIMGSWFCIY
jgi:hypothetical protein